MYWICSFWGSKSQVLRFKTGVGGDMADIAHNNDGGKSILTHENEEMNEQISEVIEWRNSLIGLYTFVPRVQYQQEDEQPMIQDADIWMWKATKNQSRRPQVIRLERASLPTVTNDNDWIRAISSGLMRQDTHLEVNFHQQIQHKSETH